MTDGPPTDPAAGRPDDADPAVDTDELAVHAVLDGEATVDQRALVARRPELGARLEQLRAVRAQLAGPVPAPDPTTVDAMIGAALDEFGADADTTAADHLTTSRPTGRSRHRRRAPVPLLVAAVVVAVLALGAVVLPGLLGSSGEDTASVATGSLEADDPASPTTTAAGVPEAAGEAARSSADGSSGVVPPPPGLVDLGSSDGLAELLDLTRDAMVDGGDTAAADAGPAIPDLASLPCSDAVAALTGTPVLLAEAVLQGRPVLVVVSASPDDGPERVGVLTQDACELVFDGPL